MHKMFVTKNTEYHLRGEVCVGVRDRRSGQWMRGHAAVRHRLLGALRFSRHGGVIPNPGVPQAGESLYFAVGGQDLITSPLEMALRPPREFVERYAA